MKHTEGIPLRIIRELELRRETPVFMSKIIVEPHQASIKIPKKLRTELNLEKGSILCFLRFKNKNKNIIEVEIKR